MKKLGIVAPLLAAFAASPAYAQDVEQDVGQGFGVAVRAELRAGYDEVRPDLTINNQALTTRFGASDMLFGAEVGVDGRLLPGLQLGAYAGIESSQVDECIDRPFNQIARTRQDVACLDAGRNLTAGVRIGLPVTDEGLIYFKGGYSSGTFQASYNPTAATPATQLFSGSETVSGYHVGGGFELNFSRNIYGKAEYVQHSYDDAFTSLLPAGSRFEPRRRQLVVGFGFRFGAGR